LAGRRVRGLTTTAGGAGGCNPPAILATRIARGPVVQLGHDAARSSAMGRLGSSAAGSDGRRRLPHPAGEVGRLPRSRLTGTPASPEVSRVSRLLSCGGTAMDVIDVTGQQ
jgi:hypothetical protein